MTQVRLLLYGVFRTLLTHGVPLGVTDYLDAVRVLRGQVSQNDVERVCTRESLRRVCEVLWARSPDEVRLVNRIFDTIEPPSREDLVLFEAAVDVSTHSTSGEMDDPSRASLAGVPQGGAAGGASETNGARSVEIAFDAAADAGGVPLPDPALPPRPAGTYVLHPQTVLPARVLAVLWRRYRRMARFGPRTELDFDATIAEFTRRGFIDRPAMRARRINRARLLILADASPSMAPWRPFLDALEQSVRLSRVPGAEMWYFGNVPRRSLFASADLMNPSPLGTVLQRFSGAGLLVVSDLGAARGFFNRLRVTPTRDFLDGANRRMRAVVWVNPLPRDRWERTTAGALADTRAVTFLPLDLSSMIRAVDVLRGIKAN
jgi:uncharacterized protein